MFSNIFVLSVELVKSVWERKKSFTWLFMLKFILYKICRFIQYLFLILHCQFSTFLVHFCHISSAYFFMFKFEKKKFAFLVQLRNQELKNMIKYGWSQNINRKNTNKPSDSDSDIELTPYPKWTIDWIIHNFEWMHPNHIRESAVRWIKIKD